MSRKRRFSRISAQGVLDPDLSTIAGLQGWMRAKDLMGVVTDGNPVGTWTDRAAVGNATASSGARPTFDADGINGRPSLIYSSGNSLTFARTITGGAFTLIAMVQPPDTTQRLWSHNSAGTFGTLPFFGMDGGKVEIGRASGSLITSLDAVEYDHGFIEAIRIKSSPSQGELWYGRTRVGTGLGNINYVVTNLGHASTYQWLGGLGEYAVYTGYLSDTDFNTALTYFENEWDALHNYIICDGDSLTFGFNMSPGDTYPDQFRALLNARRYTVKNYGVNSQTIANVNTDVATQADRYSHRLGTAGGKNVYCAWIGTNDLFGGRTVSQVQTDYAALCTARQAAGFKVAAFTIMNRAAGGLDPDRSRRRQHLHPRQLDLLGRLPRRRPSRCPPPGRQRHHLLPC